MRFLQLPQTSSRFLKARLRLLQRPLVWGSAALILLAGYLFFEYWKNPDRLTSDRHTGTGHAASNSDADAASLAGVAGAEDLDLLQSDEERAIAADIDSLPLLLSEFKLDIKTPAASPTPSVPPAPQATVLSPAEIQVPTLLLPTNSPNIPATSTSPAIGQATFNLELPETSRDTNAAAGAIAPTSLSVNLTESRAEITPNPSLGTEPTLPPVSRSALQQAMDGSIPAASPTTPSAPAAAHPPLPSSTFSPNTPILPGQPIAAPATQTSPPLGSTGYTTPPALRDGASSRSSLPTGATGPTQTSPATGSAIAPAASFNSPPSLTSPNSGLQPSVPAFSESEAIAPSQTAPFSIPRNIPGRPIGNGEVNTFSNP